MEVRHIRSSKVLITMVSGGGVANLLIPTTGLKQFSTPASVVSQTAVANLLIPTTGLKQLLNRASLKISLLVANLLIPTTGLKRRFYRSICAGQAGRQPVNPNYGTETVRYQDKTKVKFRRQPVNPNYGTETELELIF